jgi:hypothetical protein
MPGSWRPPPKAFELSEEIAHAVEAARRGARRRDRDGDHSRLTIAA